MSLLLEEGNEPDTPPQTLRQNGFWKWIAFATAIALIGSLGALRRFARQVEQPVIRFDVELGTDQEIKGRVAISPDGRRIAFIARDASGKTSLFTRSLDQAKATVLADKLEPGFRILPIFSPDSKWVGYGADHKLKKVSVGGGVPVVVADGLVADGDSSWGDNGEIVSFLTYTGWSRISPEGGAVQAISA